MLAINAFGGNIIHTIISEQSNVEKRGGGMVDNTPLYWSKEEEDPSYFM